MRRRETGDEAIAREVDLTGRANVCYVQIVSSCLNIMIVLLSHPMLMYLREGRLEMQHNRGFACPTGGCHNG